MHGPAGVLTVVLYETALGGLALLWLAPLWGVVRPGFFKLAGATVLACAALKCVGGQFQGRLVFRNADERARGDRWGITDRDRVYHLQDLAKGDVIFAATGVTDGELLRGVRFDRRGATTQSLSMRSKSGTSRQIDARHQLSKLSRYASIDYG